MGFLSLWIQRPLGPGPDASAVGRGKATVWDASETGVAGLAQTKHRNALRRNKIAGMPLLKM
ncbi:hypothetical protein AVMA1855_11050 [Acidovorax sp. SUPP1855]|uniref:hypothetical protein n=1 Tax=Acidovorax sp. SUPP1855 TaxID=431774 RepID=UPI0023DE61C4|nr:hypothetical protein [Acidovorax sp. SUPP1855]GKS84684.1 hypothetical protein AVMA1855_11050 [Acidovorax sp. SUPP1855]